MLILWSIIESLQVGVCPRKKQDFLKKVSHISAYIREFIDMAVVLNALLQNKVDNYWILKTNYYTCKVSLSPECQCWDKSDAVHISWNSYRKPNIPMSMFQPEYIRPQLPGIHPGLHVR